MHSFRFVWLLLLATGALLASPARAFDQQHLALDGLLKKQVRDGWVHYSALKAQPKALDDYLTELAAVPEAEFRRWPEKDRLAFLINLYNATTLKLIVDHYPVKSIKDIGGFFSGPWKQSVVHLFGQVITLDDLEHGIIRVEYPDARVHFALVCAAKGCPPLRAETYVGSRLDAQLDEQGRVFLAQAAKNRVDEAARVLWLSPIFKWFSGDFERDAGTAVEFAARYFSPPHQILIITGNLQVKYTDYDWTLNDQAKK